MKTVLLDKIGSVTLNCRLPREVRVSNEIHAVEGSVVAVRVLTSKSTYNTLELPSGRFSQVKPGDVVAGALGHRKALFGYSGHVPAEVKVGDKLNVLNLGGVIGVHDGGSPDLGAPFVVEVLGQVLHFPFLGERIGVPAHITQGALPVEETLDVRGIPVVAIVGSCMNAGKTAAACSLVQSFAHLGLRVGAGKTTGVSLRRDILSMEDAGARRVLMFTDLGIVTTTPNTAPHAARTILTNLARERPDAIVLELGDGLLGLYGVNEILSAPEIRASFSAVVLAASDPVAAWGGVQLLRDRYGLECTAITGPATDNTAAARLVEEQAGCPARNARTQADELARVVLAKSGLDRLVATRAASEGARALAAAAGGAHDDV
ncbi:MAG: hypothetical protein JNL90_11995 [Planctomycetes bacterium]|nr:hypothetical protein [Planctomycetota bacterium]